MMLLEEFKNCLLSEIKMYLVEQKMTTLQQAAVLSDDYLLTHRSSFGRNTQYEEKRKTPNPDGGFLGFPGSGTDKRTGRLPSGSTCFYCRKKGHVMAECKVLERKNLRVVKPDMLCKSLSSFGESRQPNQIMDDVRFFAPFISEGSVCLVGQSVKTPIKILCDTECPSVF